MRRPIRCKGSVGAGFTEGEFKAGYPRRKFAAFPLRHDTRKSSEVVPGEAQQIAPAYSLFTKKGCAPENCFSRKRTLSPGLAASRIQELLDLLADEFRFGDECQMPAARQADMADVGNPIA